MTLIKGPQKSSSPLYRKTDLVFILWQAHKKDATGFHNPSNWNHTVHNSEGTYHALKVLVVETRSAVQQEDLCLSATYLLRPHFIFAIDNGDPANARRFAGWIQRIAHIVGKM